MPFLGRATSAILAGQVVLAALCFAACSDAIAAPKRVLLLHSFSQDFPPWSEYSKNVRTELFHKFPGKIDLIEATLETARIPGNPDDGPFAAYLGALFKDRPLDLVIAVAAPATQFVKRHRQLFPETPLLITGLEQRLYVASAGADETAVLSAIDFYAALKNIVLVLPATDHIAIVIGASPLKSTGRNERTAAAPLGNRVDFTWFDNLRFDESEASLYTPPRSAVFFVTMAVDAAGVPQNDGQVLPRIEMLPAMRRYSASKIPISALGWWAAQCCLSPILVGGSWLSPGVYLPVRRLRVFRHLKSDLQHRGSTGENSSVGTLRRNLPAASTVEFPSANVLE